MKSKVNILILNWNSATEVNTLVESISYSQEADFRVVLIHNATADETELLSIPARFPEIEFHIVINAKNLGYAGGNNAGYDYLKKNKLGGDLVVINPDVIVSSNTLIELQQVVNKPKVALAMCRTYDSNGTHLYDYIQLNGFINQYKKTKEAIVKTDYAAGSCLFIKRTVVDKYGLFDASFFMYWEEVDLALRYKQLGYISLSTTKTKVIRAPNPTSRSANAIFYSVRNSFKLENKYKVKSLFVYLLKIALSSTVLTIKTFNAIYIKSFIKGILNAD